MTIVYLEVIFWPGVWKGLHNMSAYATWRFLNSCTKMVCVCMWWFGYTYHLHFCVSGLTGGVLDDQNELCPRVGGIPIPAPPLSERARAAAADII